MTTFKKSTRTFKGRRVNGTKIVYHFDMDGKGWSSEKRNQMNVVGGVYEFTENEDGQTFINGPDRPKYTKRIDDTALVYQWEIEDEAAAVFIEMRRKENDANRRKVIDTALAPIRDMMLGKNSAQRRAILATVIDKLQGY